MKNRNMFFSLCLGLVIVLSHIYQYVYPMYIALLRNAQFNIPMTYPRDVFGSWIGGGVYSMQSFLYFLIMPILVVIPYGGFYFEEKKGGYLKNIYMRVRKKDYIFAKYIATFLAGGMVFTIPLIVNLGITAMFLPSIIPQASAATTALMPSSLFYQLYFSHPYIYIFIYLIIDFIFSGLIATIGLVASFYTEYKFIVLITPFAFYLFIYSLTNLFGRLEYSPVYFLNGGFGYTNIYILIVFFLFLIITSYYLFYMKGNKDETL